MKQFESQGCVVLSHRRTAALRDERFALALGGICVLIAAFCGRQAFVFLSYTFAGSGVGAKTIGAMSTVVGVGSVVVALLALPLVVFFLAPVLFWILGRTVITSVGVDMYSPYGRLHFPWSDVEEVVGSVSGAGVSFHLRTAAHASPGKGLAYLLVAGFRGFGGGAGIGWREGADSEIVMILRTAGVEYRRT